MDADGNLLLQLVLIVILILINAFFAASEISIITVNDKKLKKMAEDGNKKASALVKLTEKPSTFLAAIQVGVTLSGLLASAIASESLADRITIFFANMPVSASVIKVLAVAVITLILSYFTLVFGELVPKRIAMQNAEAVALGVAGILTFISKLFMPFVAFLAFSTNLFVRFFGVDPDVKQKNVTEEEILMMVDVGEESGVIEENEKEMINNVFDFNDKTAGEVMTHRTDIFAVESTATLEEILDVGINQGYSRIPVFEDDLDNIIGIVFVKDLLKYVGTHIDNKFNVKESMRPALFIPDTKRCRELFKLFTEKKIHFAVVVDEYGGTAGIVTMEDLLETIVGNIQDEYDNEEADFSKINENTFTIEGTTDLDEVEHILDIELPEGDYDTIGGLIIDKIGRIPHENEHPSITVSGVTFTVQTVEDRRIEKIMAVKNPDPPKEEK